MARASFRLRGLLIKECRLRDDGHVDFKRRRTDPVRLAPAKEKTFVKGRDVIGREGDRIGRRDLGDEEIPGLTCQIGGRPVEKTGVYEAHTSLWPNMLHSLGIAPAGDIRRDLARETAFLPKGVERALVSARNRHQRPVLSGYIVEKDKARNHVIVRVRIEREVLVPAHDGFRTG